MVWCFPIRYLVTQCGPCLSMTPLYIQMPFATRLPARNGDLWITLLVLLLHSTSSCLIFTTQMLGFFVVSLPLLSGYPTIAGAAIAGYGIKMVGGGEGERDETCINPVLFLGPPT
ncbi:hypothetical protein F4779DRAFT_425261 [Xylariaceae sp. FL0662B]|nr:hypothetical protein F4779DRAFT_425261 [Xylariaceae sp. FL0662B]